MAASLIDCILVIEASYNLGIMHVLLESLLMCRAMPHVRGIYLANSSGCVPVELSCLSVYHD